MPRSLFATFLALLSLALLVRCGVWFAYYDRPDTFVCADTLSYLEPGKQLLLDGSFPSFSRTPVYPLFLAVLDKVLSPDPSVWALAQIAVSLGTIVLTCYIANQLFGWQAAFLTLLFMALDVTSAISANHLMSETLFSFLLAICFIGVLYIRNHPECGKLVFASVGILFSILSLCRPIGVLLFVVVAFWLFTILRERRPRVLPALMTFCACSLLFPAGWVARNHVLTGEYFLSTIVAMNIYEYRAAWNVSRLSNRPFSDVHDAFEQQVDRKKERSGLNAGQLAKWEMAEGIKVLKAHPFLTLRQGLDGLAKMYLGISMASINDLSAGSSQHGLADSGSLAIQGKHELLDEGIPWWITAIKIWAIIYLAALYLGILFALFRGLRGQFRTERQDIFWLLLLVIAYFTFFSVGAETYSRFRVPIAPLLAVLAGAGWLKGGTSSVPKAQKTAAHVRSGNHESVPRFMCRRRI